MGCTTCMVTPIGHQHNYTQYRTINEYIMYLPCSKQDSHVLRDNIYMWIIQLFSWRLSKLYQYASYYKMDMHMYMKCSK